MGILDIGQI